MRFTITGVPVRHWDTLRKPIRKSVEGFLDGIGTPYGNAVQVTFFGSYGSGHRLVIACDRSLTRRKEVVYLIAGICQGHSTKNDHWYEGFDLI